MITRRDLAVSAITALAVLSVVALADTNGKPIMHSCVFNWDDLKPVPTKVGQRRVVFDNPTPGLANFECHITTLNPGQRPHPPHHHVAEELMIIKDGTLEAMQGEKTNIVTTGGIIFEASGEEHGLKNIGPAPATYYVFSILPR